MRRPFRSNPESVREIEQRLLETARRKGVKPYRLAQECLDECIRLDDPEQIKFWRSVWLRVMSDEYVVSIPGSD
jgi:hypothetical protein